MSDEDLGEITPGETIVASFANYLSTVNDNTAGQGNVRIRVWSRNETVAARYSDDSAPAFAVANKVTFKMAPAPGQSADETFNVIGARPNADDVNDDTGILIAVIYDIFNYFEVPSFIINVITNSISVGGVTIKGIGGSSGTVIVDAPFSLNPLSGLDINLKPDINYTSSRYWPTRGIRVVFRLTLSTL
ncbi:MAG: hypothetical protein HC893_05620 [Chloroflexaceae bacterium]|nr:hypothetical protein [Chloroflexaceae bacterium]